MTTSKILYGIMVEKSLGGIGVRLKTVSRLYLSCSEPISYNLSAIPTTKVKNDE